MGLRAYGLPGFPGQFASGIFSKLASGHAPSAF